MKKRPGQVRLIILLGLLFMINFSLFYWQGFPGNLTAISGQLPISQIPDVNLNFSPGEIYDFLTQIGPDGRQAFRIMHLTVDLSFPFIYTLFFFLLINHLVLKLNLFSKWLPFLAVFAGILDLSENFILNFLTNRFPAAYPNLTILVELITITKFSLITVCILSSVYLGFRLIKMPSKRNRLSGKSR